MNKEYDFADPGLITLDPTLTYDDQVRCLSYIAKHLGDFVQTPKGVRFDVIPVSYIGEPTPVIGIYSTLDSKSNLDVDGERISLSIEAQLSKYIKSIGIPQLLKLSAEETLTWRDVISSWGFSMNNT